MIDEQSVSDPRVGEPLPAVDIVAVDDAVPVVRAKDDVVVLAGSGDGVVDAAAAGLLDGSELIRYTGSLTGDEAAGASQVIVTDSNRDRAHHWRGSQDVVGFTEDDDPDSPDVLREDPADERLPVFGDEGAAPTVAVQVGPVRARATAYGEPFAYRPEDRPYMAVDGDASTAWRVADRADPIGEMIRLDIDEPIDHLTLQQPAGSAAVRHVGTVSVAVDDRPPISVELDASSFEPGGQRVDIEPTSGPSTVTITIESVVVPDLTLGPALAAVGFAEIGTGLEPTVEVVRPPADAVDAIAAAGDAPVSFVLTRLRTRPSDRWRSDPEPAMVREIELPSARSFVPAITVRLDQRAADAVLAQLLGIEGPVATSRLTGVATAAGWHVADGDPATSWITPFSGAVGSALTFRADAPFDSFELVQPSGDHSPITGVRVSGLDAVVPAPDGEGRSTVTLPSPVAAGDVTLEITSIEPRITLDRRYAEPVVLPAAIAELSVGRSSHGARTRSIPGAATTSWRSTASPCRSPCGRPSPNWWPAIPSTPSPAAARRRLDLGAGTHRLTTSKGTGLHVDRIVLADGARAARWPGPDGDGDGLGAADPRGHGRRMRRGLLARARRGVPRGVVGVGRWPRPRPAAARRRWLQRLADRPERRAGRRVDRVDGADAAHDRPPAHRARHPRVCRPRRSRQPGRNVRLVIWARVGDSGHVCRRRGAGAVARAVDRRRPCGSSPRCCSSGRVGGSSPRWPPASWSWSPDGRGWPAR